MTSALAKHGRYRVTPFGWVVPGGRERSDGCPCRGHHHRDADAHEHAAHGTSDHLNVAPVAPRRDAVLATSNAAVSRKD